MRNVSSTNSTLAAGSKAAGKVDAKVVGPLVAAVGLVLIIVAIIAVQAVKGFRNRRRRIYHVSDNILKNEVTSDESVMQTETAIQNDVAEDEQIQVLQDDYSTEHLISTNVYTMFTSQPSLGINDVVTESLDAGEPIAVSAAGEDGTQWREPSHDQLIPKPQASVEKFNIPRANPLLLQLKKKNKIAPVGEDGSLTSSIASRSTAEITDEELIIIGTAIKSCPHFGRESSASSTEYDQDEPYETQSYPALVQNDEATEANMSTSFQLQDISSASEMSSAADNFYQLSADNLDDIPCTEATAVNRKDLWLSQDIVSEDVIIIDN